jgi:hypothetical protein
MEAGNFENVMNKANELFPQDEPQHNGPQSGGRVDVAAYLAHYGLGYKVKEKGGRTIFQLSHCPFDSSHTNNDAAIFQDADGKLGYHCFHNSCQGKGWRDARQAISGTASLKPFIQGGQQNHKRGQTKPAGPAKEPEDSESIDVAKLYPRGPFPWTVLPGDIARCLKQLARSCATSSTSLPGAAMAIFSSLIGTVLSVCPKASWHEPLIFWFMDIRNSGTGKTPAARMLCKVLYAAQKKADDAHTEAVMEYMNLTPKERREQKLDAPPRPRGYFATDLTLEGLREDLQGHGGQVIVLDELSSFISAQNQYKAKGNDREAWLCLHDGNPARVVRAGKSITIQKSRVSIFGGIQPTIWRESFTGEDGSIFQFDGTIFRFLPVYEGEGFHPLTAEAWSDENRDAWEEVLSMAMDWGNRKHEADENHNLLLTEGAKEIFLDWANELHTIKPDLPAQVRGFVPKLIGSVLRFAGVLYLLDVFSRGEMPGNMLGPVDIRKGIKVSEFYLGHILDAMKALASEDAELPFEKTDRVVHLAKTLESLRGDVDNGLLAVGFIHEHFNKTCSKELSVKTFQLMGSILRQSGLTVPRVKKHANGKHGVICLKWDEKTESLLKSCPLYPHCPQDEENQRVKGEDKKKLSPHQSSQFDVFDFNNAKMRADEDRKKSSPHGKVVDITKNEDNEDNEDNVPQVNEKTDLDWRF